MRFKPKIRLGSPSGNCQDVFREGKFAIVHGPPAETLEYIHNGELTRATREQKPPKGDLFRISKTLMHLGPGIPDKPSYSGLWKGQEDRVIGSCAHCLVGHVQRYNSRKYGLDKTIYHRGLNSLKKNAYTALCHVAYYGPHLTRGQLSYLRWAKRLLKRPSKRRRKKAKRAIVRFIHSVTRMGRGILVPLQRRFTELRKQSCICGLSLEELALFYDNRELTGEEAHGWTQTLEANCFHMSEAKLDLALESYLSGNYNPDDWGGGEDQFFTSSSSDGDYW
jgi:hypothetical protein